MRVPLLIMALLTLPLVGADTACRQDPALVTIPDVTGAMGGDLYVANDFCQFDGCLYSVWIYQETNGYPGLQRGDGGYPIGCEIPADTDVF